MRSPVFAEIAIMDAIATTNIKAAIVPNSGTAEIASAIIFAGPMPLISEFAPIVIGAPFTVPIRWLFAPIVVAPVGIHITPSL
jgi:hypothetical protein